MTTPFGTGLVRAMTALPFGQVCLERQGQEVHLTQACYDVSGNDSIGATCTADQLRDILRLQHQLPRRHWLCSTSVHAGLTCMSSDYTK